ncbi:RagB/SusD family nutrient uptake outer membrane protein [Portibacter lacus]|uniref:Membrane protein n=1 Tax=Portibacter lacus TaxID=1099794 RepID=A0AA37WCW6_9BACT|nr:RagB/SusD family nutrient uptake outer membrane protein [Portibacter lacus]GLR17141.1 membrane protein [Portibacter lacus]
MLTNKKIKYHLFYKSLALCLLLIGGSCTGILDKDPIATLDSSSFFQTAADAEQAINAAYNPLLFNNTNNNFYWAFAVITGDEAIPGGDGSRSGIVEMESFTYTPRTEELNTFWKLQYKGINQCNLVLDNLPNIEIDKEDKNRIMGEALFLRSYYYFMLSQVFGDVPLYLAVLPPDELKIPKSARKEVFAQIIEDCEEAASILPISYESSGTGRATKGAALALAAKTHLYLKEWEKVISKVDQIKSIDIYELSVNYQDNFGISTQNNSESVWEIQHANLQLGVGNFLNQWWASRKIDGYGFAEVREEYIADFEDGDPRRAFTAASNNEHYVGLTYKRSFSSTGHSPQKFIQPDSTATQKADGDINYPAIRYAEVLLWEAEALIELNRLAEAETPLEVVRNRARNQAENPETTLPYIEATSEEQMREALRHERKVELGLEMHRFFDLVRWGIAGEVLDGFQVGKHEVFPLPQIEIDLNNALVQNAGY